MCNLNPLSFLLLSPWVFLKSLSNIFSAQQQRENSTFISDCFGGLHATAREHLAWLSTVNARAGFWQGKQHKLYRAYCKRLSVATADALAAIVEQRVSTVINRASSGAAGDDDFPVAHFRLLTSERARAHILREDANAGWPNGSPRSQ